MDGADPTHLNPSEASRAATSDGATAGVIFGATKHTSLSLDEGFRYSFTFGHDMQSVWTDVRHLLWSEMVVLLTTHQLGPKNGSCIVPATFSGRRRHKSDAQRIDVVFLDSDSGAGLDEISSAISAMGWAAVVSSTHSHLGFKTRVKRSNWEKFQATAADQATVPAAFLQKEKGFLPHIAAGARVAKEDADYVTFEHQPCPKFRVAIPLSRPWLASDYRSQDQANAIWKERIEALAAALNLNHDQSCTDTSRLFYLPRRPADGPPPETRVLEGAPCDLFALPRAPIAPMPDPKSSRPNQARSGAKGDTKAEVLFEDPMTKQVFDLRAWARNHADKFEIARALSSRRPEAFFGKIGNETKHHIRCANEDQHTNAGADHATFVVNASESTSKGFVCHCRHAHCTGLDRLVFLKRMLEQGWLTIVDLTDPNFLTKKAQERPEIRYRSQDLHEIVDQAEQALLKGGLGLYQRGGLIVRPGSDLVRLIEGRNIAVQRIFDVKACAMVEAMTAAATWTRYDQRSESWVGTAAPMLVANAYLQRNGRWRLPVLTGLINAPTLRSNGTVLDTPGYDPVTGLLLDTQGITYPALPESPTRSDAVKALAVLESLVETFPFVGPADRSVALSAILTACIRRSLHTAPLHGFTAPMPGSGKSMLVDLVSLIATGREAGVIAQGKTEEELEKRLGALLLAGDQVIAVDNCEAPLGGEFLCSLLTQQVVRPRILGRSEAPEMPAHALVTATGNNLVLVGDLTRRSVLCRLDAQQERPELRQFDTNPLDVVKADRGRYLIAALTVLRAYHIAGRPEPPPKLGSFEVWSDWVRGALIWLGQADPTDTMVEARDADPQRNALVNIVEQWRSVLGDKTYSVAQVIRRALQPASPAELPSAELRQDLAYPDFYEALLAVAGESGTVSSRRLGKWLAANQDRVVQGRRILKRGLISGIQQWQLEAADEGRPDAKG